MTLFTIKVLTFRFLIAVPQAFKMNPGNLQCVLPVGTRPRYRDKLYFLGNFRTDVAGPYFPEHRTQRSVSDVMLGCSLALSAISRRYEALQ